MPHHYLLLVDMFLQFTVSHFGQKALLSVNVLVNAGLCAAITVHKPMTLFSKIDLMCLLDMYRVCSEQFTPDCFQN